MATATNSSGTTVTYSNSGTAVDDYFVLSAAYLTGDWNVMANDGGGTNTVMYSLDDGTQQVAVQPKGGITFDMELHHKPCWQVGNLDGFRWRHCGLREHRFSLRASTVRQRRDGNPPPGDGRYQWQQYSCRWQPQSACLIARNVAKSGAAPFRGRSREPQELKHLLHDR